jgi:anti-sigma factor RsiW
VDPILMNSEPDDWSPSPELLAAYFDGELVDRPDLAQLRGRIADWLRDHPEAYAIQEDYRRLAQLWRDTIPTDPGPAAWERLEASLANMPLVRPGLSVGRAGLRWTAAVVAVAAVIALAVWLGRGAPEGPQLVHVPPQPPVVVPEVFPVATAAEVTIVSVEGADTQTLVVGELPLHGPLELAGPDEVTLTSVQRDARDGMTPLVRIGGAQRPMIWARVDAEATEP